MSKTVFISHIAEEAETANALKDFLEKAIPSVQFFCSSTDINLGESWFAKIDKAMKKAAAALVLCSQRSVEQRWIYFEAGAGWAKNKPVVPLCYAGMRTENLPDPLHSMNALDLHTAADVEALVSSICKSLNCERAAVFDAEGAEALFRPATGPRTSTIAIDLSHGQAQWPDRNNLQSIFALGKQPSSKWNFFEIESQQKFLSREFREASGLIFGAPWRSFAGADTIETIRQWVLSGGRLLMLGYELGDWHHQGNLGALAGHFGVQLSADIVGPAGYGRQKPYGEIVDFEVPKGEDHQLTRGLNRIRLQNVQTLTVVPGTVEWLRVGANSVYRPRADTVEYRDGTLTQAGRVDYQENPDCGWMPVAVQAPASLTGNGAVCAVGTWKFETSQPETQELLNRLLSWLSRSEESGRGAG